MNTENHYQETDLGNISLNPRGEYNPEESYEYLDLVVLEGGSYVCLAENGATITGISPESGKTTQYWQVITIPGSLTPEYIAMHDRVVNISEQVEADAEEVRTAEQNVSGMELNVTQMQEQTRQSAEAAEQSKDSSAGYAASADASRQAAEESKQNIDAQVTGFDSHVAEKTEEAENDIEAARIAANKAIIAQQEQSVNEVARAGIEAISTAQSAAQTATEKAQAADTSEKNAAASETAAKLSETNATKMAEQVAADKEQVANDRTAVENAKQEMTGSVAQIEQNTQGISELKGDLDSTNIEIGLSKFVGVRNSVSSKTRLYVEKNKRYIIQFDGAHAVNCFVEGDTENYITLSPSLPKPFIPKINGYLTLYKSIYDNSPFVLTVEYENSYNRRLKKLEIPEEYHVGAGKQFTSFTACIKALKGNTNPKTVYVHSGTYDIFNEIGGSDYTLSITTDNGDWESVCVIIPANTHIIGLGDVVFNFMPTADQMTKAAAHLISPINVNATCTIENITINADNCRYGIHDETSRNTNFTGAIKKYKNVIVNKYWSDKTLGNPIPYGCGFGDDMEFTFEFCQFNQKRNTESGQAMAFHNRGDASNTRINISGCALTGTGVSIKFGSMTNNPEVHDKVFISNCYMEKNILLKNEGDTSDKTNPFDITMIGCSDIQIVDTTTTNPYTEKIYKI